MERFAKRIMPECTCASRKFSRCWLRAGGGGWVKLGCFHKNFVKNTRKGDPTEKYFGDISPDTLQIAFSMENWTKKIDTIFLFRIRALIFDFQKGKRRAALSLLVAGLWMWLNMHRYPWISVDILENTWINCSEYVRTLNMLDHLRCLTDFWRCLRF